MLLSYIVTAKQDYQHFYQWQCVNCSTSWDHELIIPVLLTAWPSSTSKEKKLSRLCMHTDFLQTLRSETTEKERLQLYENVVTNHPISSFQSLEKSKSGYQ